MKNRSDAKVELEQDILECEKEFLEKPKQLNFQPIHEPSMNWNPSPEKRMQEKKLFEPKLPGKKESAKQSESDVSEDSNNIIEQKLQNLLEETRRKLHHYENDEESPMSDDQMTAKFDNGSQRPAGLN